MRGDDYTEERVEDYQAPKESMSFGIDPAKIEVPSATAEKPKYRATEVDILMERTLELPGELVAHERRLMALNRKDDAIQKRMADLKGKMYVSIVTETEPGKLRYPTAATSEPEIKKRVEEKTDYQSLWATIYNEVSQEEEDSKKKYTNESSRQAETTTRILKHETYLKMHQDIARIVLKEMEPGKLKYTNERAREAEVNSRLKDASDYQQLILDETNTITDVQDTKAILTQLRAEFKALEIVTELLKIKLRIC